MGPDQRRRLRPRPRARPGGAEAAAAPAGPDGVGEERPPRAAAARRGAVARRPLRAPDRDAGAQPLPRRRRRDAAAAAEAGTPAQAALHRPDRRAPAALLDPGQQPREGDARLRLLRRAQAAPSRGVSTGDESRGEDAPEESAGGEDAPADEPGARRRLPPVADAVARLRRRRAA